jgi:tetratricopeptide (TPR) repeat protein
MKSPLVNVFKYVIWALLFSAFIVTPYHLKASTINNYTVHVVQRPFDSLARIKKEKRVEVATLIHKENFRHLPETEAMAYLDQITGIARELDDKALESVVFDLKADYYAINKFYNNKSIAYYQKAIDFTRKNNLLLEQALYLHHWGMFYYIFKRNTQACLCLVKSQEIFKKIGYKNVPDIVFYINKVADFYYHLGDYKNAELQLREALKYKAKKPRDRITIINTLGLIYRSKYQYPQALMYFNKALQLAQYGQDTVWVGIAKGNIGATYFMQGHFDKALPYLQTDYETSIKYGEPSNAANAMLRLIKISLTKNDLKQAVMQLNTVAPLINDPIQNLHLRTEFFNLKGQLYEQMEMPVKALEFRKMYETTKDSLEILNNVAAVDVTKMQYIIGKQLAEENRLKAKARAEEVERNAVFIVLLLLLVIVILVYSRQALKTKKDKELLQSEKRRVDDELRYTAMKLHSYTENLRKNYMLIESFKQQIDHLKNKNADGEVIKDLEELMRAHIMTDDTWLEFKKIFLKVHPNFFFDIKKNFLSLSETDIRLLTLIKLQSTNKEIANMLGITIEGVKKAKQRLRKKMKLDDDITIDEAISKL